MADAARPNDGELLARHLAGDGEAFAELARRHGAMVLAACRRRLGGRGEAEDAAQAAFLVLVRKAAALVREPDLGAWLHHVADCTAANALRDLRTRRRHEEEATAMRERETGGRAEAAPGEWGEIRPELDAAIESLPAKLRQVLVACYLEGRSQSEAAGQLKLPEGTVAVYCRRGLERLREKLGRGALRLSASAFGALLISQAGAGVPTPTAFIASVSAVARGAAAGTGVLALAEGVIKMMFWTKVKFAAAALAAVAVLALGTPLAVRAISGEGAKPEAAPAAAPEAVDGLKVTLSVDKAEAEVGGTVKLTVTFENVSEEKLRVNTCNLAALIQVAGPDADAVSKGAPGALAPAADPRLTDFVEIAPKEKRSFDVPLAGNPPRIGAKLADAFLLKPGVYAFKVAYANDVAEYVEYAMTARMGAQPRRIVVAVPGKVWKGKVQSGKVEVKLAGKFEPLPPAPKPDPDGGGLKPMAPTDPGVDVPGPIRPRLR